MFIVNPELNEDENKALLQRVQDYLAEADGDVLKKDDWGMRRLAYPIKGHREGHYYLLKFSMDSSNVKEFERRILLADGIIREIIVKLKEAPTAPQPTASEEQPA
jgi:small subunit ribosomal protein S6